MLYFRIIAFTVCSHICNALYGILYHTGHFVSVPERLSHPPAPLRSRGSNRCPGCGTAQEMEVMRRNIGKQRRSGNSGILACPAEEQHTSPPVSSLSAPEQNQFPSVRLLKEHPQVRKLRSGTKTLVPMNWNEPNCPNTSPLRRDQREMCNGYEACPVRAPGLRTRVGISAPVDSRSHSLLPPGISGFLNTSAVFSTSRIREATRA